MLLLTKLPRALTKHWQLSLLVLLLLPLLLFLGYWQLSRAEAKQKLLAVYQQQQELPALPLEKLAEDERTRYRSVIIRGQYDKDRYWLLDNRSRKGRNGYEVIMPLVSKTQTVLVNRGWVPAASRREQLPELMTAEGSVEVNAYIYGDETNAWINHSNSDLAAVWPKRVLQLTSQIARQALNTEVFASIVRIKDGSPGALITYWPLVNSGPEKHRGYAIQWFAMATVLILLFVWRIYKKD